MLSHKTLADALVTIAGGTGLEELTWTEIDRLSDALHDCIADAGVPDRAGAVALVLLQFVRDHLTAEIRGRNVVAAAQDAAVPPTLQ